MHKCIACNLGVPDRNFSTPGCKRCTRCTAIKSYRKRKDIISMRLKEKYYSNLEENRKVKAEQRRKWRAANPDKVKKENKRKYAWVKADPIKYQKQLELVRKQKAQKKYGHLEQAYRDRSKDNLTDNFIKRVLLDRHGGVLKYSDIPQELVDMKRTQLLLKRQIA